MPCSCVLVSDRVCFLLLRSGFVFWDKTKLMFFTKSQKRKLIYSLKQMFVYMQSHNLIHINKIRFASAQPNFLSQNKIFKLKKLFMSFWVSLHIFECLYMNWLLNCCYYKCICIFADLSVRRRFTSLCFLNILFSQSDASLNKEKCTYMGIYIFVKYAYIFVEALLAPDLCWMKDLCVSALNLQECLLLICVALRWERWKSNEKWILITNSPSSARSHNHIFLPSPYRLKK